MKRNRRREFVMTEKEFNDLKSKAEGACMSQSQLIRLLISGYQPPQAPDEAFYEEMDRLLKTSGELIALSRELENDEMREAIKEEGLALRKLRMGIEKKYLAGERRSPVWQ